ncbi:MAG: NfeD family protein [Pseudomonadota bacterium]
MNSWIWIFIGILLALLELVTPSGFFLLILGLASALVGAVLKLGLGLSFIQQALLFSALAVVIWVTLGRYLRSCLSTRKGDPEHLIGNFVVISDEIAPGANGSGELWGSRWRLENSDSVALSAGSEALVVGVRGVTLQVKRRS